MKKLALGLASAGAFVAITIGIGRPRDGGASTSHPR